MSDPVVLIWHRHDLRLQDHPAWTAAAAAGRVVPAFIYAPEEEGIWPPGAASQWWLHQSLHQLDHSLRARGSRLILRRGPSLDTLRQLAAETHAHAVYWTRRYEPAILERDRRIETTLRDMGIEVKTFAGALLHEPAAIKNKSGKPFQVFTPFWKTCLATLTPEPPLPAPPELPHPSRWPSSLSLPALQLEPTVPWAQGIRAAWSPGEAGAREQIRRFTRGPLFEYAEGRNRPDVVGTSRLSPHLHFGEVSPRQVWAAVAQAAGQRRIAAGTWTRWAFLAEIGWREFAHHLLVHFPHTPEQPLRPEFARFPWRRDPEALRGWQQGRTGYPIVDAGMRELWGTGWMHNRVRMIVASFLVKDLLVDWREGARWFWDTLVDADLANNTLGWQWTSGCGADAAPYFRVFNPVSQGQKFDPAGDYVRKWLPELKRLPAEWIHAPGAAPPAVRAQAGVELGGNYPEPIVPHAIAREVALEAYRKLRSRV